jgi:nitroimidazol reductase NimA-like FMN-containing flavoprotein (pyridoxamine 5'-phosphate oxidase superfamily)
VKAKAIDILDENRLLAIATNRPDGWPQVTMVSYANEDILVYFVISRQSQKFANVERDDRVSLVVGRDFHDPSSIRALSIAARASEVRDPEQRQRAIKLLLERHPGLKRLERPEPGHSAIMRANPEIITILDYSKGFGHSDLLTVGPGGLTAMTAARDDDWGFGLELKPVS